MVPSCSENVSGVISPFVRPVKLAVARHAGWGSFSRGGGVVRRSAGEDADALAGGHAALDRRRRAHGRRRALDQLRRAGSAHPGLPGLRGALPLPRAQPPPRASVAGRLRHVTADPSAVLDYFFGLVPELDTPEARSRFCTVSLVDGRNEPLARKLLARPGAIRRVRDLDRQPGARLRPVLHDRARGRARRRLGLPIYGSDPGAQLARHEDGQPPRVRRGGRAASRRPRGRRERATSSRGARAAAAARPPAAPCSSSTRA